MVDQLLVTQRVAPDHSYHFHCLLRSFPQRVALARQGHSWPNPPTLSLQLLSLMRAIAPQTPFPLDLGAPYQSLPPLLPVTTDFL